MESTKSSDTTNDNLNIDQNNGVTTQLVPPNSKSKWRGHMCWRNSERKPRPQGRRRGEKFRDLWVENACCVHSHTHFAVRAEGFTPFM